MSNFKEMYTLEQRSEESEKIMSKYPGRIPIIVKPEKNIQIDKYKYLVPNDLIFGQFIHIIRKRVNISSKEALFLFVEGSIPPSASYLRDIYQQKKDKDGFLYISLTNENTFGE